MVPNDLPLQNLIIEQIVDRYCLENDSRSSNVYHFLMNTKFPHLNIDTKFIYK
jgi:hypothetical protein